LCVGGGALRGGPEDVAQGPAGRAGGDSVAAIGEFEVLADLVDSGELDRGTGSAATGELEVLADLVDGGRPGGRRRTRPRAGGGMAAIARSWWRTPASSAAAAIIGRAMARGS
jgi:hypothetical protein